MKEIKNLKKEISDLRESLEYTESIIEEKVEKIERGREDFGERVKNI